jgi:shikimate dehydrogenase
VAFALNDLGATSVLVHDAVEASASSLVADLTSHYGAARARLARSLPEALTDAAGVVNATPVGMIGMPGNPVPEGSIGEQQWVADVIYTPVETEFIRAARAKGCRVLTGGGMCINQAAHAFRLFGGGLEPDVERMRRTFARALAERDAGLAESA